MARRPGLLRESLVMVTAGGLLWFVAMGLGKSLLAEDEPSQEPWLLRRQGGAW